MTEVMQTGGGTYDPEEGFCYFVAGNSLEQLNLVHKHSLMACNDLLEQTTGRGMREFDLRMKEPDVSMLLDSGAFGLAQLYAARHHVTLADALATSPDEIDLYDELYQLYIEIVSHWQDRLWGYIEIDLGSTDQKRETRRKLEREEGLRPIPVYHPLRDSWDYFDELASGYDRIAIGNMVGMNNALRKRTLVTVWERRRRHPGLRWVHGLGYTPNQFWNAYPLDSTDSSSWVYALRYGAPSAPGASAMGQSFSRFGIDYSYIQSEPGGGKQVKNSSLFNAVAMLGCNAYFLQEGLRVAVRDLDAAVGRVAYPAPLPGEPVPVQVEVSE